MTSDNLKIRFQGEISVFKNGNEEPILVIPNAIHSDAIAVVLNALPGVPNSSHVDSIVFVGDFGQVYKGISNSQVITSENSVTFIAQALEEDFNGTLTDLRLEMSVAGLILATKTGLNIQKDGVTRLEIRWKIIINNC